ncbi:hypothetical protein LEP1GSC008_4211 [Leptospira kirschneri serovar Bulgarica str. Nikolaevo]|uniref:Uncharacterized protein n=1 Tax=Leptospira kirschneri serovar Bulgarica str. Nikolaevo TaxID=1240687 RepID=M6FEA1_9LEPT|nr:hypothetical protein LEP1GSC008_4211 [Leptospira kirschneri serovar Bulgarica str. Nikolaevo]
MLGGFISKTDYLNLFFLYLNILSEFFNFRERYFNFYIQPK